MRQRKRRARRQRSARTYEPDIQREGRPSRYLVEIKREGGGRGYSEFYAAYSKGKRGTGVTQDRAFRDLQRALGIRGAYPVPRGISEALKVRFWIEMA